MPDDERTGPADPPTGHDDYPASGGTFYSDVLDTLEASEAPADEESSSLSEVLGIFDGDEAHEPVAAPDTSPGYDEPAAATPPTMDPATLVALATFAPTAFAPAADPAATAEPEEIGEPASEVEPAGDAAAAAPIRLPAAEAYCDMCGMHAPVDPARGTCHLGHRLDRGQGGRR